MAPLQIGTMTLDIPVILAPMAGITDYPYRRAVKAFGAGLVVSEMIAAHALIRRSEKTARMMDARKDKGPVSIQIAANDPYLLAEAAKMNEQQGADCIDINMGCPVKKVVKGQAGAALMKDEKQAAALMEAAACAVSIPVTVKMRLGWAQDDLNAPRLAYLAEESGLAAVTVHGRTRCQFYSGKADWAKVAAVKKALRRIPLIVNGDITTPQAAAEALAQSGADGVMVGRGTYGKPWLLGQIGAVLAQKPPLPTPDLAAQREIVLNHFEHLLSYYGPTTGLRISRKPIGWYSQGFRHSASFRRVFNGAQNPRAARMAIETLFESQSEAPDGPS